MAVGTEGEADTPGALNGCFRRTGTAGSIRSRTTETMCFLYLMAEAALIIL